MFFLLLNFWLEIFTTALESSASATKSNSSTLSSTLTSYSNLSLLNSKGAIVEDRLAKRLLLISSLTVTLRVAISRLYFLSEVNFGFVIFINPVVPIGTLLSALSVTVATTVPDFCLVLDFNT